MSTAAPVPVEPLPEGEQQGVFAYSAVCMVSAVVLAMPLMARGVTGEALFLAVFGVVLALARWRTGPVLMLAALLWVILADRQGVGPLRLFSEILEGLAGLLFRFRLGRFARTSFPRLQHGVFVLDLLLALAVLTYTVSYYRLLGLTRGIFPPDRRRRVLTSGGKRKKPTAVPPPEPVRSPDLVDNREIVRLAARVGLSAAAALVLWGWLIRRYAFRDVYSLFSAGYDLRIDEGVWQAVVLLALFALTLLVFSGVMSYLGQRRYGPDEAGLYLQDQLWRETRREQARLARWLAWAEKREAERKRSEGRS